MRQKNAWDTAKQSALVIGAVVVIVTIIWIDITSGIWQNLVILSGLAAGLVTFLLTVLVLDRVVARTTARRWAPVNRLALAEFLHALADDDASEISRGEIVPRSLPRFDADSSISQMNESLHVLRELVVEERQRLSETLSRWAPFLASSGENEKILLHVAEIGLRLDLIRDATIDAEHAHDPNTFAALNREIQLGNDGFEALTHEISARLVSATTHTRAS